MNKPYLRMKCEIQDQPIMGKAKNTELSNWSAAAPLTELFKEPQWNLMEQSSTHSIS